MGGLWNSVADTARLLWGYLPHSAEFWSGIIGAVVGGGISYLVQLKALRESRSLRNEDHLRLQRSLAQALFFKLIRIHSDLYSVHRHVEDCFGKAAREKLSGDPWQFVVPLANFAEPIHFSADEMSMLLGLKDMVVFNQLAELDAVHNGILDAARVMSAERRALAERLEVDRVDGQKLSGIMDQKTYFSLKPKMIEVDSLIDEVRRDATEAVESSYTAMETLQPLLKARLDITLKFESKFKPTPAGS